MATAAAPKTSGSGGDSNKKEEAKSESAWSDTYSKPAAAMHWLGAIGITFLMGSALAAQQIPNDPKQSSKERLALRQWIMHNHESVGLLMLGLMVPRVAYRLLNRAKLPRELPEPAWQLFAAKVVHTTLYGAIVWMPVSGLAFGWASGWGVPFFSWNVPGASKAIVETKWAKAVEKFTYENHHRVGWWLTWAIVPSHLLGLVFTRFARGHNLLYRMNPWARAK